jgi:ribonuclease Y
MDVLTIIFALVGVLVGSAGGIIGFNIYQKNQKKKARGRAVEEADRIVNQAKAEAAKVDRDAKGRAKDFENRSRKNVEIDIQKQKQSLKQKEDEVSRKQSQIDKQVAQKEEEIQQKLREIEERAERSKIVEARIKELEVKTQSHLGELRQKLENVSGVSSEQAKTDMLKAIEEEVKVEGARRIALIEEDTKAEAEKKAKRIISIAVSRYAGEYSAERTVSVIDLPNEELKGKIIGREGRNIRTLEALCGVDLIVDETPEAVVISGFDPVRREVARRALMTLMEDGRVTPSRIEEVVDKTKLDLFRSIKEDGDKACFELGLVGVDLEIIKLVGSLKYRTSFTQNNYTHSIEVGLLAGMMAAELGADVKMARRGGMLHDIGKALDHSIEGSHAVIGADFAKKHGESEAVCHAIRSHHEDEKPTSVIAHLVTAADALSSARPGARRSTMETYVRRLEDLESVGNSFDGVLRTFAVQAGREVRVLVDSGKVTDEQALMLSRDIARKIERELNYPGQIKITVIRETRSVEHAR